MAIRIRYLILFVLLGSPAFYQAFPEENPPTLHTLHFYVASGSRIRNVRFGNFDKNGKLIGSSRTGFRTSGRSLKYEYHGPLPLVFFEEEEVPSESNSTGIKRTPIAQATLPVGTKEVLFLFNPSDEGTESELKYDLQWVDLGTEKIPQGHITIFNTLGLTMKGAMGKNQKGKEITVKPGINPPLNVWPQATVVLALESKSRELIRIYKDTITCSPTERKLLIIFPPRFPGSHNVGSKLISLPSPSLSSESGNDADEKD